MARRPISTEGSSKSAASSPSLPSDTGDSIEEVTRCICGNEEFVSTPRTRAANANPGLFVQCEKCHVWQHGFCVGFLSEEDIPDEYYCEQCEPSFHNISMRHGILVSRYRPIKHVQGSRSPKKSRSRETEPSPRSTSESGEHKRAASRSPDTDAQKGRIKSESDAEDQDHDTTSNEMNGNGESTSASQPRPATPNGAERVNGINGSSKRKQSSEKLEPAGEAPEPSSPASIQGRQRSETNNDPQENNDDSIQGSARESESPKSSREPSEEVVPEDAGQHGKRFKTENSSEQDAKPKRGRRKNSEEGTTSPTVNVGRSSRLKRRSREEEILQRVLEESAREARELEARRNSEDHPDSRDGRVNGLKLASGSRNSASTGLASSEDENQDDADAPTKPGKRQRANGEASNGDDEGHADQDGDTSKRRRDATSRNPRQTRAPRARPGRKPGSKNQSTLQQRLASGEKPAAGANSRRTPNGVKKCRPRIPSPRSTFQEMRRRVANIIEFSGRTQVEMAEEKLSRSEGPLNMAAHSGDFQVQLEQLAAMGDRNMSTLEELTRKLLNWEEQYGQK